MSEASEDRPLAEDFAVPVPVQPGVDQAAPPGWDWRRIGASQPSKATMQLTHSDVTRVIIDVLRPSDSPPEAPFRIVRDIPSSLSIAWTSTGPPSLERACR